MNNTTVVVGIVLIGVFVVLLLGGAGMMGLGGFGMMGGYGGYGGMMRGYSGMMGGYGAPGVGFNLLGAILSLVVWALIIGGVVLLVVSLGRNAGRNALIAPSGDAALDILKTRYARGEITKEQFDTVKCDLEV